jgi:hypothetical protein
VSKSGRRVCCDGFLPSRLVAVRPGDFGSAASERARAAWSALAGAAEHDARLRKHMIVALESVGLAPGGAE